MALPTASDNVFPKVIISEAAAPASPSAGQFKLYVDSSDHILKYKNSAGTVVPLGTGVAAGAITGSGLTQATARLLGRTTASTGAIEEITVGTGLSLSAGSLTATGGGGAWPPLDQYAIDGTYGDHFTGGSLSGSWTRRNFTSGAEAYAQGYNGTYLRLGTAGRSVGDGYFRTAPAGNWTFAMKAIYRIGAAGFGPVVVDTNGTGVGFLPMYASASPNSPLLVGVTTYTTYGGTYYQPIASSGGSASPNATVFATQPLDRPIWTYLRKSSGNYYACFSLDGEIWSPEAGPIAWAGTVDRVGMMLLPLSGGVSTVTDIDIDWFNKIA